MEAAAAAAVEVAAAGASLYAYAASGDVSGLLRVVNKFTIYSYTQPAPASARSGSVLASELAAAVFNWRNPSHFNDTGKELVLVLVLQHEVNC